MGQLKIEQRENVEWLSSFVGNSPCAPLDHEKLIWGFQSPCYHINSNWCIFVIWPVSETSLNPIREINGDHWRAVCVCVCVRVIIRVSRESMMTVWIKWKLYNYACANYMRRAEVMFPQGRRSCDPFEYRKHVELCQNDMQQALSMCNFD